MRRPADLASGQPQAMPAATCLPLRPQVLFRCHSQTVFKTQLLNFSCLQWLDLLPSKTISKPPSLQLSSVNSDNLAAVAQRTSSLTHNHAGQLGKRFTDVHLSSTQLQIWARGSVSPCPSLSGRGFFHPLEHWLKK